MWYGMPHIGGCSRQQITLFGSTSWQNCFLYGCIHSPVQLALKSDHFSAIYSFKECYQTPQHRFSHSITCRHITKLSQSHSASIHDTALPHAITLLRLAGAFTCTKVCCSRHFAKLAQTTLLAHDALGSPDLK